MKKILLVLVFLLLAGMVFGQAPDTSVAYEQILKSAKAEMESLAKTKEDWIRLRNAYENAFMITGNQFLGRQGNAINGYDAFVYFAKIYALHGIAAEKGWYSSEQAKAESEQIYLSNSLLMLNKAYQLGYESLAAMVWYGSQGRQ